MKKDKKTNKKQRQTLFIISAFCALTFASAGTTLFFMNSNQDTVDPDIDNADTNTDQEEDKLKSKLFENLSAADLNIKNLTLDVKNVGGNNKNMQMLFNGGAQYLSFMDNYINNNSTDGITAKFGGTINFSYNDLNKESGNTKLLDEKINVYTHGEGTLYIDWNNTGYKVSGKFINDAFNAATLFVTDEDTKTKLSDIYDAVQKLDILTLLPMISSMGGSLTGTKVILGENQNQYSLEIPESMLNGAIKGDLVVNLICDNSGALTGLILKEIGIPVTGQDDIKISLSGNFEMKGINDKDNTGTFEDYKKGNEIEDTKFNEYYSNNIDSSPNILYTVSKLMNDKKFQFGYSLNLNEYAFKTSDNPESYLNGKVNATHSYGGKIKVDVNDGFENGIYNMSFDSTQKGTGEGNTLDVTYQGGKENAGVYVSINDTLKVSMATSDMKDMMNPVKDLSGNEDTALALDTTNDILNDTVIGDIINGKYYRYKDILNKLEFLHDGDNHTINISIKAKGLNINIPFEFENTLIDLSIKYKGEGKDTSITEISLNNIPLRKVNRLDDNAITHSYLDCASLVLTYDNEVKDDVILNRITDKTGYADLKPAVPLVQQISEIASSKKLDTSYSLTYKKGSGNTTDAGSLIPSAANVQGTFVADLTEAKWDTYNTATGRNLGKYELTAAGKVNDVYHNIQLNYEPVDNADQKLYFSYYSQNENYNTRLSLNTQTMVDMFGAVTSLISSQVGDTSDESKENTKNDILDSLTSTINSYTDYVNSDLFKIIETKQDLSGITVSNDKDSGALLLKFDGRIFGSDSTNGNVTVALSEGDGEKVVSAFIVDVTIPDTSDQVSLTLNFNKYSDSSYKGLRGGAEKYRATDSTVEAITNLLTNDFTNSFKAKGVISNKKAFPWH